MLRGKSQSRNTRRQCLRFTTLRIIPVGFFRQLPAINAECVPESQDDAQLFGALLCKTSNGRSIVDEFPRDGESLSTGDNS
jgi:hypothetical protein